MPTPRGYRPIPGSERPLVSGSELLGPVDEDETVGFTILLRQRPGSPELHSADHWQNTPPGRRSFLSTEEFFRVYGAQDDEVQAVARFLESRDLRVVEADPGRRRVVVEGSAASVNAAFGVTLNRYRAPRAFAERPVGGREDAGPRRERSREQTYRGFEGSVHVPSALAGVITAVIGLDTRRLGGPAGTGTGDPPAASLLTPAAIGQLYDFPATGAAGQTIGLFAAADEGAAYSPPDVTQFINSLPAGFRTQPHLFPIGLTVGGTTYGNDPTLITSGLAGGAAYETTQDVETSAAIGQGANINVYFTEDTEAGWEAFLSRAVFPLAGDNPPSVLSASWVLTLSDDQATIGNPAVSGSTANVLSGYLQAAAMRGITVLIAIGDWGAANQATDTRCHVSFPNSDPWLTACGGTIIGNVSASPPTIFEEFAWSDANVASPFDLAPYTTTGGGVSDTFPVPPYQTAAGLSPISKNDGNPRRGVPDVAGMVALTGLVLDGGGFWFVGTSCVAPLYAGLVAVINAFLGHSVGFLNPTLYQYGPEICNDVRFGNNDSGYTPDSPFYTAGPGWDACTGWGSIDGRRLLAVAVPAPIIETAIVSGGDFGPVCAGAHADQTLTINNTGFSMLLITDIVSSAAEFEVPSVTSYPLAVNPGEAIDVVIRFRPTSTGTATATVTILSNDLSGPHTITVTGTAPAPRLVLAIAGTGDFGRVCVGSFADEPLVIGNSGHCALSVTAITSSSAEFLPPTTLSYPVHVAPGAAIPVPIRFAPAGHGPATATLTIDSDDPAGPQAIDVSGTAPSGKLAVTGSACFGEVDCGFAEKTISVCNVGQCPLPVTSVAFSRPRRHFKLIDNPFPATLAPGSCLGVVIQYEASCDPECCELVILSDDPADPVRTLDVVAYTRCRPPCSCAPAPACGCEPRACGCGHPGPDARRA